MTATIVSAINTATANQPGGLSHMRNGFMKRLQEQVLRQISDDPRLVHFAAVQAAVDDDKR
jgi:hypothetical protein